MQSRSSAGGRAGCRTAGSVEFQTEAGVLGVAGSMQQLGSLEEYWKVSRVRQAGSYTERSDQVQVERLENGQRTSRGRCRQRTGVVKGKPGQDLRSNTGNRKQDWHGTL